MKAIPLIGTFPGWIEFGIRALPLPIVDAGLRQLVIEIIRNHPDLIGRMGDYPSVTFLIEPTDLPIQFSLRLDSPTPIATHLRPAACTWDARIIGPSAMLFAMIDGTLDGDALFFSRDITIEGNTDAILAMRNAIDAAEIDLLSEVAGLFGPFSPAAKRAMQIAMPAMNRLFGASAPREGTYAT